MPHNLFCDYTGISRRLAGRSITAIRRAMPSARAEVNISLPTVPNAKSLIEGNTATLHADYLLGWRSTRQNYAEF